MESLRILNIILICSRGKINWPRLSNFFLYFPAEIFEFSFNSQCKIGCPPGHLDRVYDMKKKKLENVQVLLSQKITFLMKKIIFQAKLL